MAARKQSIGRRSHLNPPAAPGKRPGTAGRASRTRKTLSGVLPSTIGHATRMPRWPMGKATTKKNGDRLPGS